jgi:choloylglycine hydrolase
MVFLRFFIHIPIVRFFDSLYCILHEKAGQVLLAKNLAFPIGEGIILINKRGVLKTAYISQYKKLSWRSKYGSITFNQFGKEFPLGEMNEAG